MAKERSNPLTLRLVLELLKCHILSWKSIDVAQSDVYNPFDEDKDPYAANFV
jgi:hypothetical protein